MQALGVDIGGTGIKIARVEMSSGKLVGKRRRFATPEPATPQAITEAVAGVVRAMRWKGPIGCGFPGRIVDGIVRHQGNLDESWVGSDAAKLLQDRTRCRVTVVNDADAAGLAEMRFGAGHDFRGIAVVLTFGTGIGSAFFSDGRLVPHTQLGALKVRQRRAGVWISKKQTRGLSWKQWAERVNRFLEELDILLAPELVIIGGGISRNADRFLKHLRSRCSLVPAVLENDAGIVGAALATRARASRR